MLAKTVRGFSLIEVLSVISILGILALIALPFYLRQVNRAREVEALEIVAATNKAQLGYYTELNQFADELDDLGVSVVGTPYYSYSVVVRGRAAVQIKAEPNGMTRGVAGVVWVDDMALKSKVCVGRIWAVPECLPEFSRDDGGR